MIEKKNQAKSKVSFVLSSASKLDRNSLEEFFAENGADNNRILINCSTLDK